MTYVSCFPSKYCKSIATYDFFKQEQISENSIIVIFAPYDRLIEKVTLIVFNASIQNKVRHF